MRALAVLPALLVLTAAAPARAGGFLELVGGVMIPVADDDWTNYVESAPKFGARIGSVKDKIGGMLSVDWTPINPDNAGWSGFGSSLDISANRFRVLANLVTHTNVGTNLMASARLGAGIDISHVTVESNFFGATMKASDTDTGIALDFGGGLWFKVSSVEIGAELGLPISFHADDMDDEIDQNDYSSIDIDVLFGVRFSSN